MLDPREGRTATGYITTGSARRRVPAAFNTAIREVAARMNEQFPDATLVLYGSVATGQAVVGTSDVDLLTIGLSATDATALGVELSQRYSTLCRTVDIAAIQPQDLDGNGDEAYGNRVFLRHYCAHLAGPRHHLPDHDFQADDRSARGFNGDIDRHAGAWNAEARTGADVGLLGRRLARKTLLAIAGLVSVTDGTWTTDRARAALRWKEIEPGLADGLATLLTWTDVSSAVITVDDVVQQLAVTVAPVIGQFTDKIGLWRPS